MSNIQEFNENFYLELRRYFEFQFSTNYPKVDFYWGKDSSGNYYWGDKNSYNPSCGESYFIKEQGFASVKEVVENIFEHIGID